MAHLYPSASVSTATAPVISVTWMHNTLPLAQTVRKTPASTRRALSHSNFSLNNVRALQFGLQRCSKADASPTGSYGDSTVYGQNRLITPCGDYELAVHNCTVENSEMGSGCERWNAWAVEEASQGAVPDWDAGVWI